MMTAMSFPFKLGDISANQGWDFTAVLFRKLPGNQCALREAFCADRERGVRTLLFLQNGNHDDISAKQRMGFHRCVVQKVGENQWVLREAFCTDRERGVRTLLFLQNGRLLLITFTL